MPVCRSLGRAGVPVIALGQAGDPIQSSRYCTRFIEVEGGPGAGRRWLDALLHRTPPGVLMPVSDDGVEVVLRNEPSLTKLGFVPFEADREAILTALDKGRCYDVATKAGVAVPRSALLRRPEDLEPALEQIDFPCGLKPLEGHLFRAETGSYEKVIPVAGRSELIALADPWLQAGLQFMLTEIVPGDDDQLYSLLTYLDGSGEPLFEFTTRKLRQDPPHFGVGCYFLHEEHPAVTAAALRFLRACGYRGIAQIEFKRDARSGEFKLIECNPRIALPIALTTASGLDVPLFIYRRLLGATGPELKVLRPGLRLWHPLPDFRSARQLRREGELTRLQWVRSLLHRQRLTVWARDDPWPSIVNYAQALSAALRRRIRRKSGKSGATDA